VNSTSAIFVEAVGLLAPGLIGWEHTQAVLRGERLYETQTLPAPQLTLLPPNERRRAPPAVRIAFGAAEEAVRAASMPASNMATVFASSDADMSILHRICSALATATRVISPTDFHNSVHNAAAGYWSIGASSRLTSSTVAAYDFSFAMGLLEAANLVLHDGLHTLLVAYDVPPPAPLYEHRPITAPMALAMVFTRTRTPQTVARLELSNTDDPVSAVEPRFEPLWQTAPPARALPLLALIAKREVGVVSLACPADRRLRVQVSSP
jgi:hypothetical protein